MRIYDHGILWTELKATCKKCKCDFIYRPKDVREHVEYDFTTQMGNAYRYIPCPECGTLYIYTDPTDNRYYNDRLKGVTRSPDDDDPDIIYDGGDEDIRPLVEGD